MKKYVDADKVINATTEILKELRKYDRMMREKPNWNKFDGARKIYKRKECSIFK